MLRCKYLLKFTVLKTFYIRSGFFRSGLVSNRRTGRTALVPRTRCELLRHSLMYTAPTLFNSLPRPLREVVHIHIHNCSYKLKKFFWLQCETDLINDLWVIFICTHFASPEFRCILNAHFCTVFLFRLCAPWGALFTISGYLAV